MASECPATLGRALCEALDLKHVLRLELDLSNDREELRVTFGVVDKTRDAIVEALKRFDIVERIERLPAPAIEVAR